MKFPRNARILRSQLDAAPVAAVFFLLVIFIMLGSLVYKPGIHVRLPVVDSLSGTNNLPGTDKPTITVAVDPNNRLFYANLLISEAEFKLRLARVVKNSPEPPTLVVQADKTVTYDYLVRLSVLARDVGIRDVLLAVAPRFVEASTVKP